MHHNIHLFSSFSILNNSSSPVAIVNSKVVQYEYEYAQQDNNKTADSTVVSRKS